MNFLTNRRQAQKDLYLASNLHELSKDLHNFTFLRDKAHGKERQRYDNIIAVAQETMLRMGGKKADE